MKKNGGRKSRETVSLSNGTTSELQYKKHTGNSEISDTIFTATDRNTVHYHFVFSTLVKKTQIHCDSTSLNDTLEIDQAHDIKKNTTTNKQKVPESILFYTGTGNIN
jgi:hypothetical protein